MPLSLTAAQMHWHSLSVSVRPVGPVRVGMQLPVAAVPVSATVNDSGVGVQAS